MKSKQPPAFALRLLNHFTADEAVAGDLQEEYQCGRSTIWYWRQVLAAVFLASFRRLSIRELFAAQGMVMQFVMLGLVSFCTVVMMKLLIVVLLHEDVRRILPSAGIREPFRLGLSLGVAIVLGAAIARLHVYSRVLGVAAFSASVALWAFANLYVLDGVGNLDAVLPHLAGVLVFVAGLLAGGISRVSHA